MCRVTPRQASKTERKHNTQRAFGEMMAAKRAETTNKGKTATTPTPDQQTASNHHPNHSHPK